MSHHNFLKHHDNIITLLHFSSNILSPEDIEFIVTYNKDEQLILTAKKQEPEAVWQFCFKNYLNE